MSDSILLTDDDSETEIIKEKEERKIRPKKREKEKIDPDDFAHSVEEENGK